MTTLILPYANHPHGPAAEALCSFTQDDDDEDGTSQGIRTTDATGRMEENGGDDDCVDALMQHTPILEETSSRDIMEDSTSPPEEDQVVSAPDDALTTLHTPLTMAMAGLDNLGNTCYLAAALQFLASLPSFAEALRHAVPPSSNLVNTNRLRKEFLHLMERLPHPGIPLSPQAFKEALDQRSPLFLGYRQQDAHEFLTTLLDLLDEDYHPIPPMRGNPSEEETQQEESMADTMRSSEEESASSMPRSSQDLDGSHGCAKKQKTEEPPMPDDSARPPSQASSLDSSFHSSLQSLSELDVNAIDRLLHGEESNMEALHPPAASSWSSRPEEPEGDAPPCGKLMGGRMNMTDVVLSPYATTMESDDANLSSARRLPEHANTVPRAVLDDPMDDDSNDDPGPGAASPIAAMFTTEVRVRLTCDSCKLSRTHKETFLHLSLEIGAQTELCASSIEDGLRRFFAPGVQELKCEKCFCETATQSFEITKLPPALLLHLKRFIVDVNGGDWSNITYRKNQAEVHLNEELPVDEEDCVFSEFLSSDCAILHPPIPPSASTSWLSSSSRKYVLRSIVNHIGSAAHCGHYTADAQRGENGNWFRFNDAHVSSLSAVEAMDQSKQTAYMCLYELQ